MTLRTRRHRSVPSKIPPPSKIPSAQRVITIFVPARSGRKWQDKDTVIATLRSAVTNYGATIGSHNGGLKNPVNTALLIGDFDYWHWGPDEALDITPPGLCQRQSICSSVHFRVLPGHRRLALRSGQWQGRVRYKQATAPGLWVSPYFNSTREDSYDIVENTGR